MPAPSKRKASSASDGSDGSGGDSAGDAAAGASTTTAKPKRGRYDAEAESGAGAGSGAAAAAGAGAGAPGPAVPVGTGGGGGGGGGLSTALVAVDDPETALIEAPDKRTSGLMAPIMLLEGHEAPVNTFKFSPDGEHLASGSTDKNIFLWHVYGPCVNYNVLSGHKNAVTEVAWSSDSAFLFSGAADKVVLAWDTETGTRARKFAGHTSYVNGVAATTRGQTLAVSGSDDGAAKVWDPRTKKCVQNFAHRYQVTSVAFSGSGDSVFTASVDNDIRQWDRRTGGVVLTLKGHTDTVTGISVSPDGNSLLSTAADNSVRAWDVRPFCPGDRYKKAFAGASHGMEKHLQRVAWSHDGARVGAASADRMSYVWDYDTTDVLYALPGHKGAVTEVGFHPKEPIFGSCGTDKVLYLGELAPSG